MAQTRIVVPAKAKQGDVIEIKTLIQHPMETGYRRDNMGEPIPRDIIERFLVTYNGVEVLNVEMGPGIAANPYLRFFVTAKDSGTLAFEWVDDAGIRGSDTAAITVA